MNLQIRRDLFDQTANSDVLNDYRIDAGVGHCDDCSLGQFEFMIEHQRVESDEPFDAALMEGFHRFGKFFERESDFGAGREMFQAKVDGVGAGFDRGLQLRPVTGRAHEFRFSLGRVHLASYTLTRLDCTTAQRRLSGTI